MLCTFFWGEGGNDVASVFGGFTTFGFQFSTLEKFSSNTGIWALIGVDLAVSAMAIISFAHWKSAGTEEGKIKRLIRMMVSHFSRF